MRTSFLGLVLISLIALLPPSAVSARQPAASSPPPSAPAGAPDDSSHSPGESLHPPEEPSHSPGESSHSHSLFTQSLPDAGTRLVIVAKGIPDSLVTGAAPPEAGDDLQRIVAEAPDSSIIFVEGHHWLKPQAYTEDTCGNCENPATKVTATAGLVVSGRWKWLVGASPDKSVIHTNAGYGIVFENCEACLVESLTVTDGVRDRDANATDAAIVVKNSTVTVTQCRIRDNIGDSAVVRETVVGIIGVAVREGSLCEVVENEILRNSWDGVAVYRNGRAKIDDNLIDGIDMARGEQIGGGRGVGIGITWNAKVAMKGNLVRRYWKGIGLFVDAHALVVGNVIEDVATWGFSLWDAGKGHPFTMFLGNVIFRTGACGAALVRADTVDTEAGLFMKNILVMTGQNPKYDSGEPYCYQEALAVHKVPSFFRIEENLFFANREPGDARGSRDMTKEEFLERIVPFETSLRQSAVFERSEFLKWLDSLRRN
ncbi:MAG: right-handed parallel beta-helix repeat-containing protein [Candidatus Eisenbacteria bacterium]